MVLWRVPNQITHGCSSRWTRRIEPCHLHPVPAPEPSGSGTTQAREHLNRDNHQSHRHICVMLWPEIQMLQYRFLLGPMDLNNKLRKILNGGNVTEFTDLWSLNALKTEFLPNNIQEFSSYLTGNTLRLHYKAHPVNGVWGNSHCLLWEPYGTHKYTVWAECGVLVC
jgi:hypothetical protein